MNHKESVFPKLRTCLTTVCAALMIVLCGQLFAQIDTGGVTGR